MLTPVVDLRFLRPSLVLCVSAVSKNGVTYGSGNDTVPWHRCNTATECIQWADGDHPAKFVVTFEVVGKYLLKTYSNCGKSFKSGFERFRS